MASKNQLANGHGSTHGVTVTDEPQENVFLFVPNLIGISNSIT